MYAIVEINGQQFKAEAGKKLFVHHIQNAENGTTVEFDKVLLVDKDGNVTVGAPTGSLRSCFRLGKRRQGSCFPQEKKKRLPQVERSPSAIHRVNNQGSSSLIN